MPEKNSDESNGGSGIQASRDAAMTEELDTVFDCLRAARRRYLLYYLSTMEGPVTSVEEVVEAVRGYEAAGSETDDPSPRQSVRIDLIHAHIPRLDAMGVLNYDARTGTIRFHGDDPLEEWLDRIHRLELD